MKYPAIRKPNIPLAPIVKGLGWFSLGLGLAELLAPRQLSRGAGIRQNKLLLQGYGLREIVTGLGILCRRIRGPGSGAASPATFLMSQLWRRRPTRRSRRGSGSRRLRFSAPA